MNRKLGEVVLTSMAGMEIRCAKSEMNHLFGIQSQLSAMLQDVESRISSLQTLIQTAQEQVLELGREKKGKQQ